MDWMKNFNFKKMWPFILGSFLVVLGGVGVAWMLSSKVINKSGTSVAAPGAKATSTEAGVLDPKVKYDNATGDLKEGGIGSEGTYHIERDGGPSHFVGKKVEVWGETLASKKAGWLMDVAKIQVVQ
jgi:hypothetical protein